MTLEGKTALVTGASRGIGRATALALAGAGARVVIHYGKSASDAESVAASIRAQGGRADSIAADLATPGGAVVLANEVRKILGDRLDVLVANAGVSKSAMFKDHTIADFDNLFATNVRGPFFLIQQLVPALGQGSSVVVISSLGARSVVGKPDLDNPSLLLYASTQKRHRNARQELGCTSWSAGRSRECCCPRCHRNRHVEFHQNGSGSRRHARHASA